MAKLWGKLIKRQKPILQFVLDYDMPHDDLDAEWITLLAKHLDAPRPMVLKKHRDDWEAFRRTRFLPDNFIEEVPFDYMEVEVMREGTRSRDPRNDFG